MITVLALLCALSIAGGEAMGATYYVDFDGGRDDNEGISPVNAFQHCPGDALAVGRAKDTTFVAGDRVIFKGGVHYRSVVSIPFSGAEGKPIVYDGNTEGKFGTGKAIIQGGEPVAGWKRIASADEVEGNPNWQQLWYTFLDQERTFFSFSLYEGDMYLNCSQDPNPEIPFYHDRLDTYRNTQTADQSSLTDPQYFTQQDPHYYDGAYIALYVRPSVIIYQPITGYSPAEHKVTFKEHRSELYGGRRGHSYSMLNSLRFLDKPGEYYLDEKNAKDGKVRLVLWPYKPGPNGPEQAFISTRKYGIEVQNASHVVIDGFKVYQQGGDRAAGIVHDGREAAQITDLTIRNCGIARVRTYPNRSGAIVMSWVNHSLIERNDIFENAYCSGLIVTQFNDSVVQCNLLRKSGSTAVDYYNCHRSKLLRNIVRDNLGMHANGLTMYVGCTDILVEGNEAYNSNGVTTNEGNNIIIRNNIFDGEGKHTLMGLWVSEPLNNLTITNNLVVRAGDMGAIYIGNKGTGWVIKDNVIDGISGAIQPDAQLSHNIYTRLDEAQTGRALGEGEKLVKDIGQLFVDAAGHDFRPRPGSPTIDSGTDMGVKEDFVGTARPQGKGPDIGAYEYIPDGPQYPAQRADSVAVAP
jgi:hypothetical protein